MVTLSSVGFGDIAPKSFSGRLFVVFYILFGAGVLAKALTDLAQIPLEKRRKRNEASVMTQFGVRGGYE